MPIAQRIESTQGVALNFDKDTIFAKTEAGYAEFQHRSNGAMPSRVRWALVMIDGKTTVGTLLERLGSIDVDLYSFANLAELGLIAPRQIDPAAARLAAEGAAASAEAGMQADANEKRRELYDFFTGTIRDVLGVRGLFLQLAVERAATLDDFRVLRDRYLTAAMKSKGSAITDALRTRLDDLLA